MSEADWDKVGSSQEALWPVELTQRQCWAVNVKGNLHLLRAAMPTFNENAEGGVFLISSSVAVRGASVT